MVIFVGAGIEEAKYLCECRKKKNNFSFSFLSIRLERPDKISCTITRTEFLKKKVCQYFVAVRGIERGDWGYSFWSKTSDCINIKY